MTVELTEVPVHSMTSFFPVENCEHTALNCLTSPKKKPALPSNQMSKMKGKERKEA